MIVLQALKLKIDKLIGFKNAEEIAQNGQSDEHTPECGIAAGWNV